MKNWQKAHKDYLRGMKYKEIAEKYGVSINTVKSWKSRKWNAPPEEKVAHKNTKGCTQKKLQPVIENDELTEQQKLFCLFYLQDFNATKAYQQAYQCDYKTANVNGSRLLVNASIKDELARLKAELQKGMFVDIKDLMAEYAKQAFSDITDFLEFKVVEEPVRDMFGNKIKDDDTGELLYKRRNIVDFKDSTQVDGTLIQEVKMGKDGASIKLMDKQKAMAELGKYLSIQEKPEDEVADDGFMEAIKGIANNSDVWDDDNVET